MSGFEEGDQLHREIKMVAGVASEEETPVDAVRRLGQERDHALLRLAGMTEDTHVVVVVASNPCCDDQTPEVDEHGVMYCMACDADLKESVVVTFRGVELGRTDVPRGWGSWFKNRLMHTPLTITALVEKCHAIARSKGWHDGADPNDPRQVLAWLALIHSEVSEATEDVRTRRMEATTRADGKPEGFPSELADIVIRCFDVAGALGIDLEAAILAKMDFNETRPHRHGGKAA